MPNIKVFRRYISDASQKDISKFEDKINQWFNENPSIEIISNSISHDWDDDGDGWSTCTILYLLANNIKIS